MGKYTITITPEASDGTGSAGQPSLTLHIDADTSEPRVTGVAVHSNAPEGLTATNFPHIDLTAIARALATRTTSAATESQLTLFASRPDTASIARKSTTDSARKPLPRTDDRKPKDTDSVAVESSGSINESNERAYRRMPDPHEVREKFRSIGTVTGLAKHYNVPRHTAQGWVGRLRKLDSSTSATPTGM
ncbi:hypothetical protein OG203_34870 [Nocardia sp. NBC_01499]|uniref:hypothetical protein n=1 Tax=Nocardia sp. NBC_01499 TaxID=2903597 RepID=UPI00386B8FAE